MTGGGVLIVTSWRFVPVCVVFLHRSSWRAESFLPFQDGSSRVTSEPPHMKETHHQIGSSNMLTLLGDEGECPCVCVHTGLCVCVCGVLCGFLQHHASLHGRGVQPCAKLRSRCRSLSYFTTSVFVQSEGRPNTMQFTSMRSPAFECVHRIAKKKTHTYGGTICAVTLGMSSPCTLTYSKCKVNILQGAFQLLSVHTRQQVF